MPAANILSVILVALVPIAWAQEIPRQVECTSISSILENQQACDKQPVNITGKVKQVKHRTSKQGKPYTEFTLADDSKQMTFFSYDHLKLEKGSCYQVEGTYHLKRVVGPDTFTNQVKVDKNSEGISLVSCTKTPKADRRVIPPQPERPPPIEDAQNRWNFVALGVLLLIILVTAIGAMVKNRGKERKQREEEQYRQMGKKFEEHIIELFPDVEWEITDRCSDTSLQIGRKIMGDVSYDIIVKHRRTSKQFVLQCKYRSKFLSLDGQEGVEWAKNYQIRNYQNFQRERELPYLVAIGVGGRPSKPEHLFVLPLDRMRYTFMWKKNLSAGQRDPYALFTLDDRGTLR